MTPVIVVVRDPDTEDDIRLFGTETKVVYIDLGSSFDRTPETTEQFNEWSRDVYEEVRDLPRDHPAVAFVGDVVRAVRERMLR